MVKDNEERFPGEISEVLPDQKFRVKLENDKEILAHLCGRMRQNKIKVILGDKVIVLMTLNYDINRGIIVERPGLRKRTGRRMGFKGKSFASKRKKR